MGKGPEISSRTVGDQTAHHHHEEPPQPRRKGEPRVERLRLTMLWPLGMTPPDMEATRQGPSLWDRIHSFPDDDGKSRPTRFVDTEVQRIARAIKTSPLWKSVSDGCQHAACDRPAPPRDAQGQTPFAYGEFVYFHDFVSRFLFPRHIPEASDTKIPAFYLFSRKDLKRVSVAVYVDDNGKKGSKTFTGTVERANLYVFRTGVAMLAIETLFEKAGIPISTDGRANEDTQTGATGEASISGQPPLSIDDVLALSDVFRRVYVPFFDKEAESEPVVWSARAVPESVTWEGACTWEQSGVCLPKPTLAEAIDELHRLAPEMPEKERAPPLLRHWRDLLPEALVVDGDGRAANGNLPTFRQLIDERMPILSHIELETLQSGDISPLERISTGQYMRLCFVDSPSDINWKKQGFPASPRFMSKEAFEQRHCYDRYFDDGTRYLVSPYSFIAIGSDTYFANTIAHHNRRAYFQLFMLANFEFASLMSFSSRVSKAIERNDRRGGRLAAPFREEMLTIHEDFLAFIHRFRFTGVSNQVQGQELYRKIRDVMDLQRVFEDVKNEVEMGAAHVQARDAAEQTDAAARLSVVLGLGAILGLALTFAQLFDGCLWWKSLAGVGALFVLAIFALFMMKRLATPGTPEPIFSKTLRIWLICISAASLCTLTLLYLFSKNCAVVEPTGSQAPYRIEVNAAKQPLSVGQCSYGSFQLFG